MENESSLCCSVLQCVAVWCSVLQCVAVCHGKWVIPESSLSHPTWWLMDDSLWWLIDDSLMTRGWLMDDSWSCGNPPSKIHNRENVHFKEYQQQGWLYLIPENISNFAYSAVISPHAKFSQFAPMTMVEVHTPCCSVKLTIWGGFGQ